jgi:hypothetical protein
MKHYCFQHFRSFVTAIWEDETRQDTDDWWHFVAAVDEFNTLRKERFVSGIWSIIDELMSAWRPRTTALGRLPNISFIAQKPEPLGTFFSLADCCFCVC